jgi:hypothetical protein
MSQLTLSSLQQPDDIVTIQTLPVDMFQYHSQKRAGDDGFEVGKSLTVVRGPARVHRIDSQ